MPLIDFVVQIGESRLIVSLRMSRLPMIGKRRKKRRAPIDLVQAVDQHGIFPTRTSILNTEFVPYPLVFSHTGINVVSNPEGPKINDGLGCAIHVGVGMVVVVVYGDSRERFEGLQILVEQVNCCFVRICKYASPA